MTDIDLALPGLEEEAKELPHYAGHRDRLRERFMQSPATLPDYELLEMLLSIAIPRRDTKPLAKDLIARFGNLGEVLYASADELRSVRGLGDVTAISLKVVQEASLRLLKFHVTDNPVMSSWDRLLDYCTAAMAREPTEQFRLLFLDRKNVIIADEVQQKGTVDHTPLYPREVLKRALDLHASSIIMVHNHPSGDPTPSKADVDMTRAVRDALKPIGITLHDHLIVGRKGYTSFKSQGLI